MRLLGSASWRFAEGMEEASLVALFVREATSLSVPAADGLPPRLDVDVPDRSAVLDADARAQAGVEWAGWWSAIVDSEVGQQQGATAGVDHSRWLREMAGARESVFDAPSFSSLADRPALQRAVSESFEDALRWADERRRAVLARPHGRPGHFDYDTIRAVAEQVADRLQVSPAAVRGGALIVPVAGSWWHRARPGGVVCSIHATQDPATARILLIDAFESGLFPGDSR